jgi:NitT/TauT family transport system substrate-binding protein
MTSLKSIVQAGAFLSIGLMGTLTSASAQQVVRVGANPVSASLPLYYGIEKGLFKAEGLDLEITQIIGPPANLAALIAGQIDVTSNLTTIDAANGNLKKPGVAMFIAINSQNKEYKMEQFVVRKGVEAKTLMDLKGKRIASAPGPGNVVMAKAVLRLAGLKEGDYTLDQLDLTQHVNALTAGTFDAAYTLEPAATILATTGAARTLEAGLVATYVLGDGKANGWIAGTAMTSDFIKTKPEAAKKFAATWAKSIKAIEADTVDARKAMSKGIAMTPEVAAAVPLVKFTMVSDLTPANIAEFQKFIDFSSDNGILSAKVDVTKMLQKF